MPAESRTAVSDLRDLPQPEHVEACDRLRTRIGADEERRCHHFDRAGLLRRAIRVPRVRRRQSRGAGGAGGADEPRSLLKPNRSRRRAFKKQNLTGHDIESNRKANVFEKDRFFVDKVDTKKTEKARPSRGA
jgi:hypothetical protein